MPSTTYEVNLKYALEDRATGGIKGIDRGLRDAAASSNSLSSGLGRLAGVVAGVFGIREAKKALIDFNDGMEQSKITAAGLLQLNLGGSFVDNMSRATEVVSRLQQEAKTSIGTTEDMMRMFSMLAQPLSSAGASMDDFVNLTKASVVASRAMGIASEVAARDVDQAIRGQFHSVDQFTGKILGPMGFVGEAGRAKFNALSQGDRLNTMRKALNQPAIADMAKAQGDSFAGVLSTFQDNLQIAFGKIGLPLFKEITAEIKRWNEWIDKNGAALESFGRGLGKDLASAFQYLRGTAAFFVEHKDLLLALAKTWAALKLTSMAAGGIGEVVGGLRGFGGGLAGVTEALNGKAGVIGGLGGLATNALSTAGNLAALGVAAYQLGSWIGTWIGEHRTGAKVNEVIAGGTGQAILKDVALFQRFQAAGDEHLQAAAVEKFKTSLDKFLGRAGLSTDTGALDIGRTTGMLSSDRELRSEIARQLDVRTQLYTAGGAAYRGSFSDDPEALAKALAQYLDPIMQDVRTGMKAIPETTKKATNADKPKVNVTIQRIEVASNDPDRFVIGMTTAVRRAIANPGQAKRVLREGW
jgi:hypothetical protein